MERCTIYEVYNVSFMEILALIRTLVAVLILIEGSKEINIML